MRRWRRLLKRVRAAWARTLRREPVSAWAAVPFAVAVPLPCAPAGGAAGRPATGQAAAFGNGCVRRSRLIRAIRLFA